MPETSSPSPSPQDRILAAAVRCFVRSGPAAATLTEVAEEAGVSKALIHYHFQDRDALLGRTVAFLADRIVARQTRALDGVEPDQAMDALWRWMSGELARGELRVLLEIGQDSGVRAREAVRAAALTRRAAWADTTARLFAVLRSRPRVPAALLGEAAMAFTDGLAVDAARRDGGTDADLRVVFDVFWLAALNLAD